MGNARVMRQYRGGESCISGDKSNSIHRNGSPIYSTSMQRQMHFRHADVGMFAEALGALEFRLTIVRDFKITADLVMRTRLFFYFPCPSTAFPILSVILSCRFSSARLRGRCTFVIRSAAQTRIVDEDR